MDKTLSAYNEVSKSKYELEEAKEKLKRSLYSYKEELMNECIKNIIQVQEDEGKLTERDLKIFIGHMLSQFTVTT